MDVSEVNYEDEIMEMPAEVDFSNSMPNPYVGKVRRRMAINIDGDTVDYFKEESRRTGWYADGDFADDAL